MSRENVEAFKRGSDAANRRDIDALLAVVDPDVEWHPAMAALLSGEGTTYHGHEGVRDWLRDQEEAFARAGSTTRRSATLANESLESAASAHVAERAGRRSTRRLPGWSSSRTAR